MADLLLLHVSHEACRQLLQVSAMSVHCVSAAVVVSHLWVDAGGLHQFHASVSSLEPSSELPGREDREGDVVVRFLAEA